jgi:hypothetical protein
LSQIVFGNTWRIWFYFHYLFRNVTKQEAWKFWYIIDGLSWYSPHDSHLGLCCNKD